MSSTENSKYLLNIMSDLSVAMAYIYWIICFKYFTLYHTREIKLCGLTHWLGIALKLWLGVSTRTTLPLNCVSVNW